MRMPETPRERRLHLTADTTPDEPLDPSLARVAQCLRVEVPVRRAWRDELLHEVAQTAPPRRAPWWNRSGRTVTLRPVAAAAACIACVALGVAAGRTIARPADVPLVATERAAPVVQFVIVAPGAARVNLVGDFNAWDAHATPMRASTDGRSWLVALPLPPGRHTYAFVVDGDVVADPAAPRTPADFGVPNSVVLVGRPSA